MTNIFNLERLLNFFFSFGFTDFDCNRVSCKTDCPVDFDRFAQVAISSELFLQTENFKDVHSKESKMKIEENRLNLLICCSSKCKENCITLDNEIVSNGAKWVNPEDPCTSHICYNGIVSNHTSACSGLPCDVEFHIRSPNECCSRCDPNWASFCPDPDNEDCDIACQFGFVRDQERKCDLCRCAKRKDETPTSVKTTSEPASSNDATKTVNFYLYLDPKYLTIGLAIGCCVILVACLAALGWYFHRRVYKKVPLLSFRSSSA